jgi:hypothetical protein
LVLGFKHDEDFADKQRLAWANVRAAIDDSVPCYGWELAIPEYYVVYGYDGAGYLFKGPGCDSGAGPKAWTELGDSGIGVLEIYAIRPGPVADDVSAVRSALQFALQFGREPSDWTYDGYTGGIRAYDVWIEALRSGSASGMGAAYNAAVWAECRAYAADFLAEAGRRLPSEMRPLLSAAEEGYRVVAEGLRGVTEAFPFVHGSNDDAEAVMDQNVADETRRSTAIAALGAARRAEEAGLASLRTIVHRLGD